METKLQGRNTIVVLAVLILLAFALRVHHLDAWSFWLDEGLTPLRSGYSVAEILSNRITIQEGVTRDTHPPLHYLLIHLTRQLFGESDFAYRFPSLLAGMLLVPLAYQLARRLDGVGTGRLAALLVAVNPLQIWYAQEARMYTLLVLLTSAASLMLWWALNGRHLLRHLALYLLFAGLAFYTHYTSIFVFAAQAIFWAWLLWNRGLRKLLVGAAVLVVLLLVPLVPFTVPRLFTGAEANYTFVPLGIMLQDMLRGFGLGLAVDATSLVTGLLIVGTALVLGAGLIGPADSSGLAGIKRAFLLTWLLAPILGLALGSLIKPMYMGVRHIMAGSGAFLLLAARAPSIVRRLKPPAPRFLPALAVVLIVGILLLGPLLSLIGLYMDPHYAKDDMRGLVQYFEQNAGSQDILVINSATELPLYGHYRQRVDLDAVALPIYPHYAGPDTVLQLEALAGQYERIWFIPTIPGDGRDSTELVWSWLKEHLTLIHQYSTHGLNMIARVEVYSTAPPAVAQLPDGAQPVGLRWGGELALAGLDLYVEQPVTLHTLWFDLYWGGGSSPGSDTQIRLVLLGADGQRWLDESQPCAVQSAATGGSSSAYLRSSQYLALPPGLPPGAYQLQVAVWDEARHLDGADLQTLAGLTLAGSGSWPVQPEWAFQGCFPVRFDNGLELVGLSEMSGRVKPGHPLPLQVCWRASQPPGDLLVQLEEVDAQGKPIRQEQWPPGASWLSSADWPLGDTVCQPFGFYVEPGAPPGAYRLRWTLLAGDQVIEGRPAWRPWSTATVDYGRVEVEPWPLETQLPSGVELVQANLGDVIELYGYDLPQGRPQAGGTWPLTLHWRALAVPDGNYWVFVHLVRAGSQEIVSQADRVPVDWLRPTNGWRKGEVLTDSYQLTLPADLAPGEYQLLVGMVDPDTQIRLPITYQGQRQADDQLLLLSVDHD